MPLHNYFRQSLPTELLSADVVGSESDSLMKSHLICISSSYNQSSRDARSETIVDTNVGLSTVHAHVLPCIPGYYSGVGDLFSALLLAHYHEDREDGNSGYNLYNILERKHTISKLYYCRLKI